MRVPQLSLMSWVIYEISWLEMWGVKRPEVERRPPDYCYTFYKWVPAAAAWAGARGCKRTAFGRCCGLPCGRTGRPGSWCTGWWVRRWRGRSRWWHPARALKLTDRSDRGCAVGPPACTWQGGWRTSFDSHHGSSLPSSSSWGRWSGETASCTGNHPATKHLDGVMGVGGGGGGWERHECLTDAVLI